jgi:ATP-binding cassette, subfamily C, bacterial LapB
MEVVSADPLVECLLAVAIYHGRNTSRDALTAGLPLENSRLTPSLFNRAASRAGLVSRLVKRPLHTLQKALLPAVLLLENDQACIYMGLDASGENAQVIYPDLNEAVVSVPTQELESSYSGVALLVRTRFRFDKRVSEIRQSSGGHWFWDAVKENRAVYKDVLIAAFCINIFALAMPLFTMNVYDRVVPNRAIETLWILAMGVGVVMLADLVLRMMRAYFLDLAGRRIDIKLSAKIMERVLGMTLESKPQSTGSFAANLRSFETLRDFLTSATVAAVIDMPFTLIFILVIGWIAWPMVIPLLLGVLTVLAYTLTSRKKMQQLTESTYRASSMRNATLIETLIGLDTLKAMGAQSLMQRKWEKTTAFLARIGVQLRMLSTSNVSVTMAAQQLVTLSVIVIGVYLISDGLLSMGGLIACSMLSSRAIAPLGQVTGLLAQYHSAVTAMSSLDDIMAKPVERPPEAKFLSRNNFRGEIEFKDVSFAYPSDNPESQINVLKNVSLKIKQGEHVAILGRVGSGKSTIQKLAMGLYKPTGGSVLIDGIDQRQLDPAELRHHIGYVPQDVTLFYGTLRENLTLAYPQADDAAIVRAAEYANLTEYVNTHPQGFDLIVGERGESLSGGQRKAVAFARAVIHEPSIYLMDEPTGSMDHSNEAWVHKQMVTLTKDKTFLVVTHRTSLLDLVDRIIVVDSGQIVADGPKQEVVEALRTGRIGRAS